MSVLRKLWRLPGDERAQAMTEFVIVLPVILLMFFACIQTLLIAQANQLGNYAAFAAARSYATSYSKFNGRTNNPNRAHNQAVARAKNAALLIMAPISSAKLGEGLPLWDPLRNSMKTIGGRPWQFYGLAEGYGVASIFRMKNFNLRKPAQNSRGVVKVSFNYDMPISVPGLAEIWNYLAEKDGGQTMDQVFQAGSRSGGSGFNAAVDEVMDGLAAMESKVGIPIFAGMSDGVGDAIKSVNNSGYQGASHTIRLRAKSVCGFEPWSGSVRTDDITPYCEAHRDESKQGCIDAAASNDEAAQIEADECDEAHQADEAYEARVRELNAAIRTYNNCMASADEPSDCDDERDARDAAQQARDDAHAHATKQAEECEDAGKVLQQAVDNMEQECQ